MTQATIRLKPATEARVCQAARPVALDPSIDDELPSRWPALTTMISCEGVRSATLGIFFGFGEFPAVRVDGPVSRSNAKLKRLLVEAMLDSAALKDLQPVPPFRPAISDEAAVKHTSKHDIMSLRIEQ